MYGTETYILYLQCKLKSCNKQTVLSRYQTFIQCEMQLKLILFVQAVFYCFESDWIRSCGENSKQLDPASDVGT